MSAHQGLIAELEDGIAGKSIGQRAAVLRRLADLFVSASSKLSKEQIALFDDVMSRLVQELDSSARAAFGHLLVAVPDAPPKVIRQLALDEAIDVAGPILSQSEAVSDVTLVEGARTRSQAHLLAISRRKILAESVTDVLIERGAQEVVLSAAANPGAAFSEFGYSTLVQRSSRDDDLALCVWSRPEIPRQHLLKLLADASESLKLKLASKDPRKAGLILEIVAQASREIQSRTRGKSVAYEAAYAHVLSLHRSDRLSETQLAEFARAEMFDETTIALSHMCDLPIGSVERALVDGQLEQIIILAKAIGLSWETTKAILLLQIGTGNASTHKLDQYFEIFVRLKAETARKAIQYFRLRERAVKAGPS